VTGVAHNRRSDNLIRLTLSCMLQRSARHDTYPQTSDTSCSQATKQAQSCPVCPWAAPGSCPGAQDNMPKACRPTRTVATGPGTSQTYTRTAQAPAVLHPDTISTCVSHNCTQQSMHTQANYTWRKANSWKTGKPTQTIKLKTVPVHSWSVHFTSYIP
jgi:hypothetical protein